MKERFRQSMAWLHTWVGLWLVWVLFAIFFTGTLGVFDDAITRWMKGPTAVGESMEFTADQRSRALELAQDFLGRTAPRGEVWSIGLPSEEDGALRVFWRETEDGPSERRRLDPATGAALPTGGMRETEGGHHFVHMHFEFHAGDAGIWLVGVAAMAMLVAMVSGIVVHKKIFADFFTFRPGKGQRSWLDAHNALSVLTLPFQFMIAYTGLVIFWSFYVPVGIEARYGGDEDGFFAALNEGPAARPLRDVAAPVGALPALLSQAEARLGRAARFVVVNHPGDASASARVFGRVEAAEGEKRLLGGSSGRMLFDATTGEVLDVQMPETRRGGAVLATKQTMDALHFVQFGGYPMKWLYFICGMAGAAMIATGALLFTVKRRRKPAAEFGAATARVYRAVEALNVAGIAGLMLACAAYLWINRLLPLEVAQRAHWEVWLFFAVWGATLVHALLRAWRRAWVEQLAGIAALCLLLPAINVLTTGDQFVAALLRGDGESAGVELVAIAFGLLCAAATGMVVRGGRVRSEADGAGLPASASLAGQEAA